jgi:DNA-directed RNA polymerase subunit M/transcription elongation factor TFIIS
MDSTIRFCSNCNNKYYHNIDNNELKYYCRVCGNVEHNIAKEALCVLDTQFQKESKNFDHLVNKYTKLDPTLPRINKILCPNPECTTNTEHTEREIIYLRYDDVNIKYIYVCSTCDTVWKTDEPV